MKPGPGGEQAPFAGVLVRLALFVCPLLFFTDLTRNPYFTQIALLNVALLAALAWLLAEQALRQGALFLPRTPVDLPWLAWILICALSWLASYRGHANFFHPAMASEGRKAFLFLLVNALLPFYLAVLLPRWEEAEGDRQGKGLWLLAFAVWGALWALFPAWRGGGAPMGLSVWDKLWDSYGVFLWVGGLALVFWTTRKATAEAFLRPALAAGALAAAYGVLEYFNVEWIWPKILNPYGGRAVSTFGNPNFLSSYLLLLLPLVLVRYAESRGRLRAAYGALFLLFEASLVASLTRSSWAGASFALACLFLSRRFREELFREKRAGLALAALAAVLLVFWPRSGVGGGGPTVWGRLAELRRAAGRGGAGGPVVYGPWHQRLLIWSCAWQMALENPVTGKGWGLFELFYPFYQGPLLAGVEVFRTLRTHANNAHNEILEVLSQTGLAGLGIAVWLWAVYFHAAVRFLRRSRRAPLWLLGLVCGVAGMLADNLLNVSLHFAVPAFLCYWSAGLAAGFVYRERRKVLLRPAAGWSLAVLASLLALGGGWGWWRKWNREADYFLGFKLMRANEPNLAIPLLQRAYAWDPHEVNADYELGNAYAGVGDFEKAAQAYREALKANAGYDEIYYNLGSLLGPKLGRWDQAEKYYRTSAAINPTFRPAVDALIARYFQDPSALGKNLPAAEELLREAVLFFPDQPVYDNDLGSLLVLQGKPREAREAYAAALRLDPDFAAAEKNLRAAGPPSEEPILDGLARLRDLERRISERDFSPRSLALAQEVAADFPMSPKARFLLGSLLLAQGDLAEAKTELEWVIARVPGHLSARLNLAMLLERQGDKEAALEQYRAALRLAPSNPIALGRLREVGLR